MMEVPWVAKRSLRGQVMPLLLLLLHLHCSALPLTASEDYDVPDYSDDQDYVSADYMPGVSGIIRRENLKNITSCLNGDKTEESACSCHPCWEGEFCHVYEDHYSPRFLVHAATAVVPENITGPVYRAWATDGDLGLTCPLGPGEASRCPCAAVNYQLFAAPGDHHFFLHQSTGVLSRNLSVPLYPGTTHNYKLMVQSTPKRERIQDLQYDILDLKIYVSPDYVTIIPWT
ncbi:uncharacterized protein LOC119591937 [Penaeus monodon]|uniref:uncharacterized protein LOC119591937 n=1 Tax=Penaeus monodon TaxID=6687 RepID=UPI0018A79ACA|nr:uncharacterized protein LOC119591937 [Penaeus monodon]XP_037796629.1 uncharacterized protein LOC119591937 [Penaeus monodon]